MTIGIWNANFAAFVGALLLVGCGEDGAAGGGSVATPEVVTAASEQSQSAGSSGADKNAKAEQTEETFELKPLSLSGLSGSKDAGGDDSAAGGKSDTEKQIQSIISHLQPLQILLGQWRGTTRREYENFKAVDNHEWVWDLRTDAKNPALTINSDKSPYVKQGRLSWNIADQKFTLTATDSAGTKREFVGDFTDPVHEIVGSDDKLHKVFRLEFNQVDKSGQASGEMWQLSFEQQENNRYLLEVAKRRGSAAFARYDTVSTQREGTSFALSDTDYAEKTCIISEGLGTTEIVYKGRSYWVCCSGCKAAFDEDPETWIARAAARPKKE
ncbi:MAG: hypothetical protein U0936_08020 [Planctomycetaceae bacterium]